MTAVALAEAYRRRDLSPVEVARACLAQIERVDPTINAFCWLDETATIEDARRSEDRHRRGAPLGPLDGVPVAVKDVIRAAGWPTRKGSRTPTTEVDSSDAPAVERLRAGGAVLAGKTTTPELGWKAVTDSPLTGVTRNPWNTARTAGGSSGGSAAAVAARMVPLALGTDGAGSVRIPSSFCGVVGLKPTHGLVPQWPPSPFGILSHLGPHARTSQDAALLLATIAGPSGLDPHSVRRDRQPWADGPRVPPGSLRVAYCPRPGDVPVDDEILRVVGAAVDALASLGAEVRLLAEPPFEDPRQEVETIWNAGAARALDQLTPADLAVVDPGLRAIADVGRHIPATSYVAALEARVTLSAAVDRILSEVDVLITPTMPIVAFDAGGDVPPGWPDANWMSWTPFTYPFNLTGHPALSVPCGLSSEGLPIGVQLVGGRFADGLLLGIGSHLETALTAPDVVVDG